MMHSFDLAIKNHLLAVEAVAQIKDEVERAAAAMITSVNSGKRVFWLGNGGSAADAQHYAAELMVRYTRERKPIPSVALTTDSSLLTAHSNDYEFTTVFSRQVEALVSSGDVVVGISTSGNSKNVLLAMKAARQLGAVTVGMLGRDGGKIAEWVEYPLIVKCDVTAHVQECHLLMGHYLCDRIEEGFSR